MPDGPYFSFEPVIIVLTIPYEGGQVESITKFVDDNRVLYINTLEISASGTFLGFEDGEIGGEFTGTYNHQGGIALNNQMLQNSLDQCYETRAYLQETFNDPTYPYDCSSQESRMETDFVEDSWNYTSAVTGTWQGMLDEDGTGGGTWEITIAGITTTNGYSVETTTYSGTIEFTATEFDPAMAVASTNPGDGTSPEDPSLAQPPEDALPPADEALPDVEEPDMRADSGFTLSYDEAQLETENTYRRQTTLLWGAGAVGMLTGSATALLLSMLKGAPASVRYYPDNRPFAGTDNYVSSRMEGSVGNIDLSPASVTPPGVGQKIGADYDYQWRSKGQAEFASPKSSPESFSEPSGPESGFSLSENPEQLGDQTRSETKPGTGRDELSGDEVWANMGEDFYKVEQPEVKPDVKQTKKPAKKESPTKAASKKPETTVRKKQIK